MKRSKLIVLLISIIVPIIAGVIVASYSFNRYDPTVHEDIFNDFMNEEVLANVVTTEERIEIYRKLANYYYEEKPIYKTEVKKNGQTLFVLEIYRNMDILQDPETREENDTYKYEIFAYNVNYKLLKEEFKVMFDDEQIIENAEKPRLIVNFYPDANYNEEEKLLPQFTDELDYDQATDVPIGDYNSDVAKDETINAQVNFFRENTFKGEELTNAQKNFKEGHAYIKVTAQIELSEKDQTESLDTRTLDVNFIPEEERVVEGLFLDAEKIDKENMKQGYQGTVIRDKYAKIGYNKWIIKKYVWWQTLIAVVIAGGIMVLFYAAFTAESDENVKKVVRKNKKKKSKK